MRQTDSIHSLLPHFCITESIKNRLATQIFGSAPCHEIMCLKILVCFKKLISSGWFIGMYFS